MTDRELSVREAARRVHRAEETVRRWIWSGKLPARKLGNTYRVRERDVDAAAGVPAPREAEHIEEPRVALADWLADLRRWQETNGVPKRPGGWRLVIENRWDEPAFDDR